MAMGTRQVGSGRWAVWLASAVGLTVWMGNIADGEARSYKRRERDKYECRASQEVGSAELEKARRYWESGMIYFDSKDYAKARNDFTLAYELSHLPDFLVNLAQVNAKIGNYQESIRYLESYIQECPGAPDTPLARQRIDDLRIEMALKEGAKPPSTPVRLPPKHALALMGAGAGLLAVGGGLGLGALLLGQKVGTAANHRTPFNMDLQSMEKTGQQLQSAAIACGVIGGVSLLSGAIWSFSWLYEQKQGLQLALVPQLGMGNMGLQVAGSF